jgi:hypothetical protein
MQKIKSQSNGGQVTAVRNQDQLGLAAGRVAGMVWVVVEVA